MRGLVRAGVFVWAGLIAGIVFQAAAQHMPAPIVNPPGVRLHLDLADAGPFREMQMIRGSIQLDRQREPSGVDGGESFWTLAGYLVDPPLGEGPERCGVPERPCARNPRGSISESHMWGLGQPEQDGPRPLRITEQLHLLPPGNYRIAAVAVRHQDYQAEPSTIPASPRPVVMAVSNWLPLTILPASDDWIQQTLTQYSPTKHPPPSEEGPAAHRAWLDSIHQLQLLDHPAAWQVISALQHTGNYLTLDGLQFTRRPEQACTWLRQGLDDARRRVDSWYLRTTNMVCGRVELPPQPPPPASDGRRSPEYTANMRAHVERQQTWHRQQVDSHGARLLASLPQREGQVLADALSALLEMVPSAQARAARQPSAGLGWSSSSTFFVNPFVADGAEPSWAPRFRQGLPQWVASLDPELRSGLLGRVAQHMESPEWASVLEAELRQLSADDASGAMRHLIYSLATLDAKRAANLVAAELRKPETWLHPEMLKLLPVEPRPFTDEELVQLLVNPQAHGRDEMVRHAAVARFASPEAAPRFRELYEQKQPACQFVLVGYFVRADPDYAATILGSNWDMQGGRRPCQMEYLSHTASYGMGPVLEEYLTAHLFHSQVPLKQAAALSLQAHGSPAAQDALWEAMRHFHQYWKGREDELARNPEGQEFEMALARALMYARHWTMAMESIQQLRSLCTGTQCLQGTGSMLRTWQQPLVVHATKAHAHFHGQLAHYSMTSREELLERISQLPAGTRVRVFVGGLDAEVLRSAVLKEAAVAGLVVEQ
ncbi:MAG: hypothetical protein KIT83_16755 [Bryobacterales bacterium]|nr:hypothetical protein [Bryobacterales bacterium]